MLKKIGIPLLTLAALLIVMPTPQAKAGVRFGVYLGAPAYVAPAPVYPPAYVAPAPGYYNPYPAYAYPVAPAYVYPYANWGWGGRAYIGGPGHYVGRGYVGHGFDGHGFARGRR
jgi:hypothetical protein